VLFMMGADMFLVPILIPAIASTLASSITQTAFVVTAFGVAYAGSCPLIAVCCTPGRVVQWSALALPSS
jgi:predicted MFS family arabinose efflux permease